MANCVEVQIDHLMGREVWASKEVRVIGAKVDETKQQIMIGMRKGRGKSFEHCLGKSCLYICHMYKEGMSSQVCCLVLSWTIKQFSVQGWLWLVLSAQEIIFGKSISCGIVCRNSTGMQTTVSCF